MHNMGDMLYLHPRMIPITSTAIMPIVPAWMGIDTDEGMKNAICASGYVNAVSETHAQIAPEAPSDGAIMGATAAVWAPAEPTAAPALAATALEEES